MKIKINESGYLKFAERNWSFAGDKRTWLKFEDENIVVAKALKGTISSSYSDAIEEFLEEVKSEFSFDSIGYGERKSFKIDLSQHDLIMS